MGEGNCAHDCTSSLVTCKPSIDIEPRVNIYHLNEIVKSKVEGTNHAKNEMRIFAMHYYIAKEDELWG